MLLQYSLSPTLYSDLQYHNKDFFFCVVVLDLNNQRLSKGLVDHCQDLYISKSNLGFEVINYS